MKKINFYLRKEKRIKTKLILFKNNMKKKLDKWLKVTKKLKLKFWVSDKS